MNHVKLTDIERHDLTKGQMLHVHIVAALVSSVLLFALAYLTISLSG